MRLVELHAKHCSCRGGNWPVQDGSCPSPGCLGPNREMPKDSVVLPAEQWQALGQPADTEAFVAALKRTNERRRRPRFDLPLMVRVRPRDTDGLYLKGEVTATDNLSEGGMMVPIKLPLAAGSTVLIEEQDGPFRSQAEVLETRSGEADGVPRARLRFMDRDAANYIRRMLYATWQ